jgi:cytochrome c
MAGLLLASVGAAMAQAEPVYPGLGRAATPREVAAWDIDVRPDFKGLPEGSGSVAKGQDIWEARCASCHGIFGDANEVFSPLIGGVTPQDIQTGRVAKLTDATFPGRTTMMKVATLSTLWDYINRAMPWNQPKSLSVDDVYAVTAFLLNLSGVVPDNFVLSRKNMDEVQARMPNRNGMTTRHAMWPGKEFGGVSQPDTHNVACMKDCAPEPKVASFLPDFARNQHGNLADQNRLVGPQRGADTTRPEAAAMTSPSTVVASAAAPAAPVAASAPAATPEARAALALIKKHACVACHAVDRKVLGPAFVDVAKKYPGKADYLTGKIKSGGTGIWGAIAMPAQNLGDADAKALGNWLASGAAH